jgi:hypothetical protein
MCSNREGSELIVPRKTLPAVLVTPAVRAFSFLFLMYSTAGITRQFFHHSYREARFAAEMLFHCILL